MATFVNCWIQLKAKGYKHANGEEVLDKKDREYITSQIKERTDLGVPHTEAAKEVLQSLHDESRAQLQSIYDQVGVKPEPAPEAPAPITVEPTQTETAPPTQPPPTPAEVAATDSGETTGIAARYREQEQPGSVIEGVGKTPDEARSFGHDFINKGGNPYDAINNKGPKRELWQDVGIARAEYERLGNEKRAAEAQLEANPNDPQAQKAFDNADAAQRKWSKDAQPILTRAGDALRAATRAYPREINTFSDFTDIVNDQFKGEVNLTPEKRAEIQKMMKEVKKVNQKATDTRAAVTDEAVRKAGGKVLSFDELKKSLQSKMEQKLSDCVI